MDLIWLLSTLIFASILVYMLTDCEVKHKNDLYWLGLFVTLMIIIDSFVWIHFGHEIFMKRYTLLAQIPLYIAYIFISKYKGIKLLFIHLTVISLVSSIVLIAIFIASYFSLSKTHMNLICIILYIPTGFITYKYIRPYILYMLRNTNKGWLGCCITPLTYFMITYSYDNYNTGAMISKSSLAPIMRGLVFTFVSYFMILWLFKQSSEQMALQNKQNLQQMQIASSKQNLEALKESQEKTIIYRHDMRHHLNLINAYLVDNNKESAQNYIKEIEKSIVNVTVETYCSNYSLNLILNYYISKAKQEQIDVETQIELPKELSISDMDLCLIFSNAIENAVKALTPIKSSEERVLRISCKYKNNKLHIEITNSFEGTLMFVNKMPINFSEKHGYGTKSIASITEKYNGIYSFITENGIFITRIIL